jgi:asparagine synthetase B (glutamine-hydrolysing)
MRQVTIDDGSDDNKPHDNLHLLRLQIDLQSRPDGKHPKLEKYLLRKAFDVPDAPYLPESVLFRQKEQFSDGVGYSWVDALKDYANEVRVRDVHH